MKHFSTAISRESLMKALPYLAAILVFLLLSLAYVSPVLEGRQLLQSDIVKFQGMSKEIADYRAETGREALWTNAMFSGMPAFQISVVYANNIANFFHKVFTLWLPRPADMIFLYFAGFFMLMLLLGVNPWVALAGAVGFAFSSYHFIILEAGHNSKAVAIGYMAPVLGAIIYAFRQKPVLGSLLFAIFMGLQLWANHFQITYYLGFIVLFYGIFQFYEHLQQKQLPRFFRSLGLLLGGLILAVGLNAGNFWSTYAYTSETMRGGSELSFSSNAGSSGLEKEYITAWSYGVSETFTLFIPNTKGGATGKLGNNPSAMDQVDPAYRSIVAEENQYWGDQPFTSGPVYIGAVVLFLFVMSLFLVKGPIKWTMLAAIVLSVILSWGKNFMPLTDFFIDFVPGYNKFRAVSMTLTIAALCIPVLAFMGLQKLYKEPQLLHWKNRAFWVPLASTAGLALLLIGIPGTFFSFLSQYEQLTFRELMQEEPGFAVQFQEFINNLERARMAIFRADAVRSLLFSLAAAVLVLLLVIGKVNRTVFMILLVGLITLDMWPVNKRYLNNDSFVPRRRAEVPFPLRPADQYILNNGGPGQRVLDLTENTFNSSRASYFHHSIGGYHGAKLQRYQDLIDLYINPAIRVMVNTARDTQDLDSVAVLLANMPVINMLNTRHIIYDPNDASLINSWAAGNAWFVREVELAGSADEEILALETLDLYEKAIVYKDFYTSLPTTRFDPGNGHRIELISYTPNHLTYEFSADSEQMVVFSEIFYPQGWQAYLNGNPVGHFRANYILRAMIVPAGEHEIEFRFSPKSYYLGIRVSLVFSLLLSLIIIGYIGYHIHRQVKSKQE